MEQEAVYLINERTYLHLRENSGGVGYALFDKNTPLPVEEGQIPHSSLGDGQHLMENAREYYLAEHLDEPLVKLQKVAVTTLKQFRSSVRKRGMFDPDSLPKDDVQFIDPQYNEIFRVPNGGTVQVEYPDGRQYSRKVEYRDDYHMIIGSSPRHICEFAELMARSHAIVQPEPLTQQDYRVWNLDYDFYLTVQSDDGAWSYSLYRGDYGLLEQGTMDAPNLTVEEVKNEIVHTHNLDTRDCKTLHPEEFAQKLAEREAMQEYRMKQFQNGGQDGYLIMQLRYDADRALHFASMEYLKSKSAAPIIQNYEIMYRGDFPEEKPPVPVPELLESLYREFNCDRPLNFQGHSLSVSDIILLNLNGNISAHYVDSIGFKELADFLPKQERPSVLGQLKEKCDAPECSPAGCRKVRDAHEL